MSTIAANLQATRGRISEALQGDRREVTLIAVSKTQPPERVREAFEAGCRDFGENYVQEAVDKIDALADLGATWHFIGRLQTNKAREIAARFDWVHGVDRLRAAEALVLVTPIWNFGWPAMLKGFFDRVFVPGVSFKLEGGKVRPNLMNIRKLAVVTTYGGARWRAFVLRDPPRRNAHGWLKVLMHPGARLDYLALYDMNRADDARRRGFLGKVRGAMERF